MLRLFAISFAPVVSLAIMSSGRAAPAGDACEAIGLHGLRAPAARIEIDREAATKVVVHVKRACDLIRRLEKDHPVPAVARPLDSMGAQLDALVLTPIYREHPELRGLTAAEPLPPTPKPQTGARPVMGAATATYLRWALSNIQRNASHALQDMCKGAGEPCFHPLLDLSSEISFAKAPVYVGYPRLFLIDMQETDREIPARTARSDAAFRKNSPKPGAVLVSPAALKMAQDFLRSLAKEAGRRCEIAAFSWSLGGRSKGPDDAEWKTLPPGVGLGSFPCRQIPPDTVRRIGGLPIVFFGDTPERFAGKIVDRENGRLVLKDRGGATPNR